MDQAFMLPASPGTPLTISSPDRVNVQRPLLESPLSSISVHTIKTHSRDSSVNDKVAAFNSLAYQSKQLERKTNDAALKRAMLGREEAESEMRRYRDEVKILRRQVDEGRDRERKVGERLESVMENYGRAKETHAHTQTLWEKEVKRLRKESMKCQSAIIKLQEELKTSRSGVRTVQADLDVEKSRGAKREQEAFEARYQLVGVQEELVQMQEQIKLVEQERDALRTIAKNEEIARIAAEGRIPLPASPTEDEFSSPKKQRLSLSIVTSSAAAEEELYELQTKLEWEMHRATRAHDQIEYLEVESRHHSRVPTAPSNEVEYCEEANAEVEEVEDTSATQTPRPSAVFVPAEEIFRPVTPTMEELSWISPEKKALRTPVIAELMIRQVSQELEPFARTPSCEPPSIAIPSSHVNMSLMSLFDAPQMAGEKEVVEADSSEESGQVYHTISTTRRIPLAEPADATPKPAADTPRSLENVALEATMDREKALAQIRERRGRARSLAQGTLTPRKQMIEGGPTRRDISAPAIRSDASRGRSQIRA